VWKTIGLASDRFSSNERAMMALAAWLSEPATSALELYFVPAAWPAKPRPTSRTSQTLMTSARWRAEKTAMRLSAEDMGRTSWVEG
jgi:hypothetical protein